MEVFCCVVCACLCLISLVWVYVQYRQEKKKKPPLIPGGIPFIGNVTGFDRKRPHITLSKWSKKYGDIFRIKLFGEDITVLNSSESIKEALHIKSSSLAGRPKFFRIDYGFHYSKDVIFGTITPKWMELKKIIVKSLKVYGTSHENIENIVKEEVINLCEAFSDFHEEEFDPSVDILTAVVNCLSASILGKRFARGDSQLQAYKAATRLFSEACSPVDGIELDLFPWLRFFGNNAFNKLTNARDALDHWIDTEIFKAKTIFQSGNPQCIFDVFYQAHKDSLDDDYDFFITEEDVRNLFVDMLVSGTFTTAIALNAFCLFMASMKPLQQDVRKQIHKAFGKHDLPCYNEKEKVPMLEAMVYEILRFISHVPLSLPHLSTEDTTIGGYHIPKNKQVLLNLWNLHHDEKLWNDPWTFNPKRFLDIDGNLLSASSRERRNLLPFGGGKRACPGETMSKQRIFVIAGTILQRFELQLNHNCRDDSKMNDNGLLGSNEIESGCNDLCDPRNFQMGLILEPKPFKIKASKI